MAPLSTAQSFLEQALPYTPLGWQQRLGEAAGGAIRNQIESFGGRLRDKVLGPMVDAEAGSTPAPSSAGYDGPPPDITQEEEWMKDIPQGSSTTYPGSGPAPQGSVGMQALIDLLRPSLEGQRAALERTTDPEYIARIREIEQRNWEARQARATAAGLAQSRERTAREIQQRVLDTWGAVTQAQINRDTALAQSMMATAYIAGTPNANVLTALSGPVAAAIGGFTPGKSVI